MERRLQLRRCDAGILGGAQVQRQLLFFAQRGKNGDGDEMAGRAVDLVAGPNAPPGKLHNHALEIGIKVRFVRFGPIDMGIAQHGAPDLHPLFKVLIRHSVAP